MRLNFDRMMLDDGSVIPTKTPSAPEADNAGTDTINSSTINITDDRQTAILDSKEFLDSISKALDDQAKAEQAAADAAKKAADKAAADKAAADKASNDAAEQARLESLARQRASRASSSSNNITPSLITQPVITPKPITPTVPPVPQKFAAAVKTAPIDTILFNDSLVPIEIMTDLIFEDIGGQELINIARNDTVNGQDIIYQPIKNLTSIQQKYNPNNILGIQQTSDKYFEGFPIRLEEKMPNYPNGPNGESVYIDPETGDLIIELANVLEQEQVESQISINGTIYEAEFGVII